jgi:hypothetical protein
MIAAFVGLRDRGCARTTNQIEDPQGVDFEISGDHERPRIAAHTTLFVTRRGRNAPRVAEERTITRQQLYEDVWSRPISKLSGDYGISDVGLAKLCRRHHVPVPGRGYWARVQVGKSESRTPLPDLPTGSSDVITLPAPGTTMAVSDRLREVMGREALDENKVVVPERLKRPHQLVSQTRAALVKPTSIRDRGVLWTNEDCLDLRVTAGSKMRALCVADALIKALGKRGMTVRLDKSKTVVDVDGELVEIRIEEKVSQIPHVWTEEEKRKKKLGDYLFVPANDHVPSGRLVLRIPSAEYRPVRKRWADGQTQRVENMLNDFIVGLHCAAEAEVRWREEREAWQRAIEEKERLRREAKEMQEKLLKAQRRLERQTERWTRADEIRRFVASVEADRGGVLDQKESQWAQWARTYADEIDPLVASVKFRIPAVIKQKRLADADAHRANETETKCR